MIRRGQVGDESASLCRKLDPDYLVLGQPEGEADCNVFTQAQLEQVRRQVEKETGARLILAGEVRL